MKRRGFLAVLLGIAAAPAAAALPVAKPVMLSFDVVLRKAGQCGKSELTDYVVVMHPATEHQLRCIEARERWKNEYRERRIAARWLREQNELRRVVGGGVDVLEMRRLAAMDLKAQGVAWA